MIRYNVCSDILKVINNVCSDMLKVNNFSHLDVSDKQYQYFSSNRHSEKVWVS